MPFHSYISAQSSKSARLSLINCRIFIALNIHYQIPLVLSNSWGTNLRFQRKELSHANFIVIQCVIHLYLLEQFRTKCQRQSTIGMSLIVFVLILLMFTGFFLELKEIIDMYLSGHINQNVAVHPERVDLSGQSDFYYEVYVFTMKCTFTLNVNCLWDHPMVICRTLSPIHHEEMGNVGEMCNNHLNVSNFYTVIFKLFRLSNC